ncbi:CCHC-type domain-containing protein [Abeliophyllum distichum]|uniref:CCHC-type domain-containing protein n=1 Tax=Abeliophyllum distichum TaxID=126358 RepID=A0ABD1V673_9LAMI
MKDSSNTNMSDEELDDLFLLVNKWRGFRNNRRFQNKDDKCEEKNKKIICYDCDKPGHKRIEYPNKKKFNKKKALQATWDDSDEDDIEEDEVQEEIVNMCFMAIEDEVPRKVKSNWFLDSGCSKHMTEDRSLLSNLKRKDGGHVTFGDNAKEKIIGIGNIGNRSSPSIENVLLVNNIKHNLLSRSQLCDKGYLIKFDSSKCLIEDAISKEVLFMGSRSKDVYIISIEFEFEKEIKYLSSIKDDS